MKRTMLTILVLALGLILCPDRVCKAYPACWDWNTQCHGDCGLYDAYLSTPDFFVFKGAYGTNYWNDPPGPVGRVYDPCADLDRDGYVGTGDFFEFKDRYATYVPTDCPLGGVWPPVR